jgi:uncharacterized protein (DUF983 family)
LPIEILSPEDDRRFWLRGLLKGLRKSCPRCGKGRLFNGYLKIAPACPHCGLDFSGHQADDAPPYVTALVVGHVGVPLTLAAKQVFDPPLGLQFALALPALAAAAFWFLPISKGGLIGLQWANRMHGFGEEPGADFESENRPEA